MTMGGKWVGSVREFLSLERDVLVLSVAMFSFSLGFQMTTRYMPRYMSVLGAGAIAIGLYSTFSNIISAAYPYPGGSFSDSVGSKTALTIFGFLSSMGFAVWLAAPTIGDIGFFGLRIPSWTWVFPGLFFAQAWKSLGLGATFAVVRESVSRGKLATGFASTESFRRIAFLLGPLLAALVLTVFPDFLEGFRYLLGAGLVFAVFATFAQHELYTPDKKIGKEFLELDTIINVLRSLPGEVTSLLIADSFVRFANGMVYAFFIIVVTERMHVDLSLPWFYLSPDAYFGVLLAFEMVVALLVMVPSARIADSYGLKPVVLAGFLVYAIFPVMLINASSSAVVVAGLFAFSGLRFAGLPAHKALIVGPAAERRGGRVTGSYYLVRNTVVMPSGIIGGVLYSFDPVTAFGTASVVGLVGTAYFWVYGKGLYN